MKFKWDEDFLWALLAIAFGAAVLSVFAVGLYLGEWAKMYCLHHLNFSYGTAVVIAVTVAIGWMVFVMFMCMHGKQIIALMKMRLVKEHGR